MSDKDVVVDRAEAGRMLGLKVRAARKAHGLTQRELARLTGISRSHIQNIERNRTKGSGAAGSLNPHRDTIVLLAEVLDVEVAYLVDPEEPVKHAHY